MKKKPAEKVIRICVTAAVLVVFLCAFFLVQSGVFAPMPVNEAKADNCYTETLSVITDEDYLPYSFYDQNGNISGHDVEAITLLANEMHMNLNLEMAPWPVAIDKFVSGQVDVLLTCDFFDRYEDNVQVLTTEPVTIDEFVVFSKSRVRSIEELYQKNIAVMENGNVLTYLEMLGLFGKCTTYKTNKDALKAVENGLADCAIVRYAVGEAILKEFDYSDVISTLSIGQSYICFGVSRDNHELADRMNLAIEVLKENGELNRLHNKWLTTFIHEYSIIEIISSHLWILFVFGLLLIIGLFIYFRNEKRRLRAENENSERIMALEDDFESLYDVELASGRYESFVKGETFGDINNRMVDSNNFFADVAANISVVYEEDRSKVTKALEPDSIRKKLQTRNNYDLYYRLLVDNKPLWVRMRMLYKGLSRKNVIIGVFNAEEEMAARELAIQTRKEQIGKMAGGISSYIVDPDTACFVVMSQDEHLAENYTENEDFHTSMARYINSDVFIQDREAAKEGLSLKTMVEHLASEKEYTYRYRDISSGSSRWYELRAVKLSENEILYGFTDRNDEIISNLILDKLESDFFAMFCVNLDSGLVDVVKDVPGIIAAQGTSISYTLLIAKLQAETRGEISEFIDRSSDIEYLKQRLLQEDKSVFVYKSQLEDGTKWGTVTEFVLARHSDGRPSMVAVGFSLLDSEAGEKEELKLELKNARDAAEAANRSKTNFLFNMSHDIRTPMNAITGFTSMATKYIDDKEKVLQYLKKIDTSGQQLLILINQVLEMARIEAGRVELTEISINVKKEFDALVTVFGEQAKVNGLEFYPVIRDIVHYDVFADQARVSSIVLNITGNAMKYTPKGGRIDFEFREIPAKKEGYASYLFIVADTGIGMSQEYQKVLFDPFTREKSTTVSRIQGTGLGMSIVKDTVDILGGEISVTSAPGEGTRFEIAIDFRIDEQAEKCENSEAAEPELSLAGLKVLLVEDNELNREIALDMLGEEGLNIEIAEDGSVAVEIMRERGAEYFDFILMDIQMPIMGGFEATGKIRAMYPQLHAPIIALSANAFAEDKEASIEAGMDDHVAKPIKIKELIKVLKRFLG